MTAFPMNYPRPRLPSESRPYLTLFIPLVPGDQFQLKSGDIHFRFKDGSAEWHVYRELNLHFEPISWSLKDLQHIVNRYDLPQLAEFPNFCIRTYETADDLPDNFTLFDLPENTIDCWIIPIWDARTDVSLMRASPELYSELGPKGFGSFHDMVWVTTSVKIWRQQGDIDLTRSRQPCDPKDNFGIPYSFKLVARINQPTVTNLMGGITAETGNVCKDCIWSNHLTWDSPHAREYAIRWHMHKYLTNVSALKVRRLHPSVQHESRADFHQLQKQAEVTP